MNLAGLGEGLVSMQVDGSAVSRFGLVLHREIL